MAIVATPTSSELVLVMDNGVGASGQPLTISRRYSNVKAAAANDDVYAVATSLSGLQDKTMMMVQRRDTVELEDVV
ncbi:MAG: DUF1659 domain-containing protein [Syntrophomonadaceae bacterium]|jgi:hypothetical protein